MNFTVDDYLIKITSPIIDERRNAAWNLGRFRDIRIPPVLIKALNDSDASVRVRVAEALGNIKYEDAIMPLIYTLQNDQDLDVRVRCVESLGKQADFIALPTLLETLRTAEPILRSASADALAHFSPADDITLSALVETWRNDPDSNTRYSARRTLLTLGATQSAVTVQILLALPPALPSDETLSLLEMLGQLAHPEAHDFIKTHTASPDSDIAELAQWALRRSAAE